MSLKAKIEAVVYASEEPVTLVQLAGLFGEEVLAQRQQSAVLSNPPLELHKPELPLMLSTDQSGPPSEDAPAPSPDLDPDLPPEASVDEGATGAEAPLDPATGEPQALAQAPLPTDLPPDLAPELPAEQDEKRAARQRDREVREVLRDVLDELIVEYANGDRGIEIREVAGGYRFATKPECHDAVRGFVKRLKPPMKLTLQALETLAVIAYKQPITAPEVSEIRGVDSAGVLGSLMARKLITTAGRKQVIGRPILYKTTKEFLLRFGLRDLSELPSIEEFEKMAGELAETDEAVEAQNDEAQNDNETGDRELPFGDATLAGMDAVQGEHVQSEHSEGEHSELQPTGENSEIVPDTPSHPQAETSSPQEMIEEPVEAIH